ncbi:MAG: TetR/AcrR family transcriptional regulator, partial [Bacteroidales bacterium]|nr:TetR/AcrR family transcriptional regulator [Bacteroidales bacterium]
MNTENIENKQHRRTKKELNEAIENAVEQLIVEQGFNEISFAKIAELAKIEVPVLYNRFKNVDDFLENYAKKYDYWLTDLSILNKRDTPKTHIKQLLVDIINKLYDNDVMQRVLVWELNDTHRVTRLMALSREMETSNLLQYFSDELEDFDSVSSLLIAGIYYLILHRKISTFCSVNYNTPRGKRLMIETVEHIIDAL